MAKSSFMIGFSESYLADLGRVIAAWSHIESQFDLLFLSLVVMRGKSSGSMSDPRVNKLMGMAFERRLKEFRTRLEELELSDDSRVKLDRTLSQLMTLRRKRDEIAHSVWSPSIDPNFQFKPNTAMALFKSWRNSKPHEWNTVAQKSLKATFGKMSALFWDLVRLSLDPELRAQRPRQPSP